MSDTLEMLGDAISAVCSFNGRENIHDVHAAYAVHAAELADLRAGLAEAEKQAAEWEQQFEKTFDACSKRITERDVAIARAEKAAAEARSTLKMTPEECEIERTRRADDPVFLTEMEALWKEEAEAARAENAQLVGLLRRLMPLLERIAVTPGSGFDTSTAHEMIAELMEICDATRATGLSGANGQPRSDA